MSKFEKGDEFDLAGWARTEDLVIPPEQFEAFRNDLPVFDAAGTREEIRMEEDIVEEELMVSDGPSTYDSMLVSVSS